MAIQSTKIITVWYDDTSDADDAKWIVDICTIDGGASKVLDVLDTEEEAIESGIFEARDRGLALYTVDSNGVRNEVVSAEFAQINSASEGE